MLGRPGMYAGLYEGAPRESPVTEAVDANIDMRCPSTGVGEGTGSKGVGGRVAAPPSIVPDGGGRDIRGVCAAILPLLVGFPSVRATFPGLRARKSEPSCGTLVCLIMLVLDTAEAAGDLPPVTAVVSA